MRWAVLIVRILVGGAFLVFGANHFYPFLKMEPPPDFPLRALGFMGALNGTRYLDVVKALEVIGGILVVTGRLTPLGLTLLVPVTVNIALWDAFLMEYKGPPIGTILLVLEIFLLLAYRRYFASVFTTNATPGF